MKLLQLKSLVILINACLVLTHLYADIPPIPDPPRLVNDFADILTDKQEASLENTLRVFHHNTSNQIVVLSVFSLDGYDPFTYAHKVGQEWGVGQQNFNNGIVLLIKPKYSAKDKGQTFIAIGYGLEAAIPDFTAKQIVENKMIPHFQRNDYYQGILKATNSLMSLATGEISTYGYNKKKSKYKSLFLFFLPFAAILAVFLFIIWSKNSYLSISSKNSIWRKIIIMNSFRSGNSNSGSWESFHSSSGYFDSSSSYIGEGGSSYSGIGGGSYGGGGGSSFSSFGGGSFGGGGAGGSW